jgi:hypothetical protein
MRSRRSPWFTDADRYERECLAWFDATGTRLYGVIAIHPEIAGTPGWVWVGHPVDVRRMQEMLHGDK